MSRVSRLRHVRDLYTKGQVVELIDGTPLWVRALNPFEQDTARQEASVARARMTLAIKEETGSDERTKVRAYFFEDSAMGATEILVNAKVADSVSKIHDKIRFDPEWVERLDILARGQENPATPLEEQEQALLGKIAEDYAAEITKRIEEEREFQEAVYAEADKDTLFNDYLEIYCERRGADVALAEHRVHQILFATHVCEGVPTDGEWDHSKCNDHEERLFIDASEVRTVPEEVLAAILLGLSEIDMTVLEAKNSDRQGSSYGSSPLPSEQAESTPSTPDEIPSEPTGS